MGSIAGAAPDNDGRCVPTAGAAGELPRTLCSVGLAGSSHKIEVACCTASVRTQRYLLSELDGAKQQMASSSPITQGSEFERRV